MVFLSLVSSCASAMFCGELQTACVNLGKRRGRNVPCQDVKGAADCWLGATTGTAEFMRALEIVLLTASSF